MRCVGMTFVCLQVTFVTQVRIQYLKPRIGRERPICRGLHLKHPTIHFTSLDSLGDRVAFAGRYEYLEGEDEAAEESYSD